LSADLESSEQQIVERLQRLFAGNFPAGIEVGIGDDAAVLTGIKNGLDEVKAAKKTGKKLQSLSSFLDEYRS
jgi:hypothetical protein